MVFDVLDLNLPNARYSLAWQMAERTDVSSKAPFVTLSAIKLNHAQRGFALIPSNIHLQLIIPSNIHLQCLCSTKNEKKTTSRRQFGIENYFYSESLAQPRNVKNKYVILRHLGDMCLYIHLGAARLGE